MPQTHNKNIPKRVMHEILDDGEIISSFPMTQADDDWIRAGRLRVAARKGDKAAAKKLKEMENTDLST